jgi:hypothetical protein
MLGSDGSVLFGMRLDGSALVVVVVACCAGQQKRALFARRCGRLNPGNLVGATLPCHVLATYFAALHLPVFVWEAMGCDT